MSWFALEKNKLQVGINSLQDKRLKAKAISTGIQIAASAIKTALTMQLDQNLISGVI
jgi:hypothetical protein